MLSGKTVLTPAGAAWSALQQRRTVEKRTETKLERPTK